MSDKSPSADGRLAQAQLKFLIWIRLGKINFSLILTPYTAFKLLFTADLKLPGIQDFAELAVVVFT